MPTLLDRDKLSRERPQVALFRRLESETGIHDDTDPKRSVYLGLRCIVSCVWCGRAIARPQRRSAKRDLARRDWHVWRALGSSRIRARGRT